MDNNKLLLIQFNDGTEYDPKPGLYMSDDRKEVPETDAVMMYDYDKAYEANRYASTSECKKLWRLVEYDPDSGELTPQPWKTQEEAAVFARMQSNLFPMDSINRISLAISEDINENNGINTLVQLILEALDTEEAKVAIQNGLTHIKLQKKRANLYDREIVDAITSAAIANGPTTPDELKSAIIGALNIIFDPKDGLFSNQRCFETVPTNDDAKKLYEAVLQNLQDA